MDPITTTTSPTELAAALLQGTVTLFLAVLSGWLALRYHRQVFRWWAVAWWLYVIRIACILAFFVTASWNWLYLHQVITGWTAIALLVAALSWIERPPSRTVLLLLGLFPPFWSWIAIFQLEHFLWAALPMVLFLSGVTIWTAFLFFSHRRKARRSGTAPASGATVLAWTFLLWGLHHLDYPILRAQGAWSPWGYYLDTLFLLGTVAGILLLVVDEQRGGLEHLSNQMLAEHEEERRRLSRELHDETAQVLSAVKMQLGVLAESLVDGEKERVLRAQTLLDEGIRGIRRVTDALRPSLLDDLGLVPALRSLVDAYHVPGGIDVQFREVGTPPTISDAAELALFRALQEGLSNVTLHAGATHVRVELRATRLGVTLIVADNGKGMRGADLEQLEAEGHTGLAGMRERFHALGGSVELRNASPGTVLTATVPVL